MKGLKIIEGWEKKGAGWGLDLEYSVSLIDDLLEEQAQLTREETIKECMEKINEYSNNYSGNEITFSNSEDFRNFVCYLLNQKDK